MDEADAQASLDFHKDDTSLWEFDIVFLDGSSIKRTADKLSSVGWAIKEAAVYLEVPAGSVRISSGTTVLDNLALKLFDTLGADRKLSVIVASSERCGSIFCYACPGVADDLYRYGCPSFSHSLHSFHRSLNRGKESHLRDEIMGAS